MARACEPRSPHCPADRSKPGAQANIFNVAACCSFSMRQVLRPKSEVSTFAYQCGICSFSLDVCTDQGSCRPLPATLQHLGRNPNAWKRAMAWAPFEKPFACQLKAPARICSHLKELCKACTTLPSSKRPSHLQSHGTYEMSHACVSGTLARKTPSGQEGTSR